MEGGLLFRGPPCTCSMNTWSEQTLRNPTVNSTAVLYMGLPVH